MAARMLFAAVLAISAAAPALGQTRDLRRQTDVMGTNEISFCSRPSPDAFGFPGHAFVAFSEPTEAGRNFRAVGHTVATSNVTATVFTYFNGRSVAGRDAEEVYTHVKQACLTLLVDRSDFQRAIAAAQPTFTRFGFPAEIARSMERYSLSGNDCLDFIVRVANTLRQAGLVVPGRSPIDTPPAYIQKLVGAN
jgi:hypothetical protein